VLVADVASINSYCPWPMIVMTVVHEVSGEASQQGSLNLCLESADMGFSLTSTGAVHSQISSSLSGSTSVCVLYIGLRFGCRLDFRLCVGAVFFGCNYFPFSRRCSLPFCTA
jgi:hypothetical protein